MVKLDMIIESIEYQAAPAMEVTKPQLRMVDLNLLTVFDAVMQEQNITRAAHSLGMSQPAVSNAVSRLKVMFNDELFVRYGRGIQPTARAVPAVLARCARLCSWCRTSCRAPALSQ
nr:transcriptional activator for leuABCD operon [Raoultella sp. NCTC 9187]